MFNAKNIWNVLGLIAGLAGMVITNIAQENDKEELKKELKEELLKELK